MTAVFVASLLWPMTDLRPTGVVSWHLAEPAVWFDRPARGREVAADCRIGPGLTRDRGLFLVPLAGRLNGHTFYLGYLSDRLDNMTDAGGWQAVDLPGLIFTRWGTRDRAALRPATGGYWVASDHEGDHVSVRRPTTLPPGRYTFALRLAEADAAGCWVAATVRDHAAGVTHEVGRLHFPGAMVDLGDCAIAFLEVPGGRDPRDNNPELPAVRADVGGWSADGRPLRVTDAEARYRSYVPQKAWATWAAGGLRIEVGPGRVPRRRGLRPDLIADRPAGHTPVGELGGPFLLYRERLAVPPAAIP